FAPGLLDFVRTAKTFLVPPRIAARPVEAGGIRPFSHTVHRKISAADDQDVTRPALDNLRLDRLRPHLVLSDAMDKDATVTSVGEPRRPRLLPPFELGHELVVGKVGLLCCQIAVVLPADPQHPIRQREDMVWVLIHPKILQERIKWAQIAVLEQ